MSEGVSVQGTSESRPEASNYAERVARDAALAIRVRQEDGAALEELYRIYFASLCRTAAILVGDEAPDVVQKVFFKIWLIRDHWTVKTTVLSYLLKSVRNRALDMRLQGRQRRANERGYAHHSRRAGATDDHRDEMLDGIAEIDQQLAAVYASGEARAMRGDVERAVNAAAAAMSPRCREVFTMMWEMRREEAFSYREIGEALGLTPSTVRQHWIKARDILEEHLERAGWVNILKRQAPRPRSDGRDAA